MDLQAILMGDVVGSTHLDAESVHAELSALVEGHQRLHADRTLSPYTITLGDEFQGVATSLAAAIGSIFYFDEERLRRDLEIKLHFALHLGEIETPLNPESAHRMIGPGLAHARAMLTDKGRDRARFAVELPDERLTGNLVRLFGVVDAISARWRRRDYALIADMLTDTGNQAVGARHGKNRSQIWKRRKSLLVEEYRAVRDVIIDLVGDG